MLVARVFWLIALAAAFSVGWLANGGRYIAQIAKADAVRAEQRAQAAASAMAKEQAWQAAADKLKESHDAEIRSVNTRLAAALVELRNRPSRPDPAKPASVSLPGSDGGPKGCTGASLYAQDAQFLIREAARADEIRSAYIQCAAQYEVIANDGRR